MQLAFHTHSYLIHKPCLSYRVHSPLKEHEPERFYLREIASLENKFGQLRGWKGNIFTNPLTQPCCLPEPERRLKGWLQMFPHLLPAFGRKKRAAVLPLRYQAYILRHRDKLEEHLCKMSVLLQPRRDLPPRSNS